MLRRNSCVQPMASIKENYSNSISYLLTTIYMQVKIFDQF